MFFHAGKDCDCGCCCTFRDERFSWDNGTLYEYSFHATGTLNLSQVHDSGSDIICTTNGTDRRDSGKPPCGRVEWSVAANSPDPSISFTPHGWAFIYDDERAIWSPNGSNPTIGYRIDRAVLYRYGRLLTSSGTVVGEQSIDDIPTPTITPSTYQLFLAAKQGSTVGVFPTSVLTNWPTTPLPYGQWHRRTASEISNAWIWGTNGTTGQDSTVSFDFSDGADPISFGIGSRISLAQNYPPNWIEVDRHTILIDRFCLQIAPSE